MRLVVFDVDGTLVDSQAHILAAMAGAFAALDQPVPDRAACLAIVGLSLPVAMARLAPHLEAAAQSQLVAAYKDTFTSLRADDLSPLYPGAAQALARLAAREDVALGIATGKSRRGVDHVLSAYGWTGLFQTVQVADDHPSKPHPSMLRKCLQETGVAAQDAIMVGDTVFDMEMAQAAGLHGLGVAWGYHPASQLGPNVIDTFADLEPCLDRIWSGGVA